MKKQPKVSIVVPIYGVEKYLNQCVDSILAQTLKDIEIILVDDGSKDKCPQIVDEYAKKDSRVIAVHQPNGGYGRAVNHGIELANGEYIGIIESDDWIELTMFEKLYDNAKKNKTDITKCMFYKYNSKLQPKYQNTVWKAPCKDLTEAPDGAFKLEEWPLIITVHASIWTNLYRADFIKQQKVIETRSASYQDFPFMIEAMCRADKISVVKEPLLHYRVEEGQNSSTVRRDERLILLPKQCIVGKNLLIKYGKYETLKEEFYFHAFMACIGFYFTIYMKYKREYFNVFHELLADIATDSSFNYKYFNERRKHECSLIVDGHYFRSLILQRHLRIIRRYLLSIRISNKGCCFQFFGFKYATGIYKECPASIKFSNK